VVIPSLPGYGFSGKPAAVGWGPERIARAWAVLMERLGYTRYVAQGGDWGTAVAAAMGRQAPGGLLGIHASFAQMVPAEILGHIRNGDPTYPCPRPSRCSPRSTSRPRAAGPSRPTTT
jgi:pimeloyl-ACP methyl ester carboxylesterase